MISSIRSLVILSTAIFSFSTFAKKTDDVYIGGAHYQNIVQIKDVISDVLPPPAYIIESYLMTFILLNDCEKIMSDKKIDEKEMQSINSTIEYLRQLEEGVSENGELEGYFKRIDIWKKSLSGEGAHLKQLKDLMTVQSVKAVSEFFDVLEKKFIPAIKNGDLTEARKNQSILGEAYYRHRAVVDEIVIIANKRINVLESKASTKTPDNLINGPRYNEILLLKDLIADVLPPPCFIIETYLSGWEMLYEREAAGFKSSKIEKLRERVTALEQAYRIRHDYWVKNLKIDKLKNSLCAESHHPGKEFFKVFETEFFPSFSKDNIINAKNIMNVKLIPLYKEHRKFIDKLVIQADKEMIRLESEFAKKNSK